MCLFSDAAMRRSAGTTAVWATENTRAGIFDAMKRKETCGTSGTMIRLRFFGGWDYRQDLLSSTDFKTNAKKQHAMNKEPNREKSDHHVVCRGLHAVGWR
jgi:hypothetical protein